MADFVWSANVDGAQANGLLSQEFCNFVRAAPERRDLERRKTEFQEAKELAAQAFEDSWARRIVLARWQLDLGAVAKAAVATSNNKRRSPDAAAGEPASKRVRTLDGSSTVPSRPSSPTGQNHSDFRITCKAIKSGHSYQGEDGCYRLHLAKNPDNTFDDLKLALSISKREREIFENVLDLLEVDTKCRARTVSYLSTKHENGVAQAKLIFEFWARDAADIEEALVVTASKPKIKAAEDLLEALYPGLIENEGWSAANPRTFYDAVHVPAHIAADEENDMEVPGLQTVLYPFQKRSVAWMLDRESGSSTAEPTLSARNGFRLHSIIDGKQCLYNPLLQLFTTDAAVANDSIAELRGGILAEEMGLGKTVELIALMQLNKRREANLGLSDGLHRSKATLVVAPRTIIQQWYSELQRHCPELRVLLHEGFKAMFSGKSDDAIRARESLMLEDMLSHDVVLVEYAVLAADVNVAVAPRERSRRSERKYERRKSVLVQIDWWRVILDEAQLIETGTTSAAQVALQIPRQNAWAVTGTPLKKEPSDLFGLFLFLGLQPYSFSDKLFRDLAYYFKSWYQELIGRTTLRHTKDLVKEEMQLPPQKRVVITVPFTAIEENNYNHLFEQMIAECGLNLDGSPAHEYWEPDNPHTLGLMRSWLERLRKTCLHPEVDVGRRRAAGGREGPLRTVEEVLTMMQDVNETSLRTEERNRLQSMLKRGQILEFAKKPQEAMEIWKQVEEEVSNMVAEDRKAVDSELARIKAAEKGASKKKLESEELDSSSRLSRSRNRLRVSLEIFHSATFFIANAVYQIKTDEYLTKPESDDFKALDGEEIARYEKAKLLRRELLTASSDSAHGILQKIRNRVKNDDFVKIKAAKDLPITGGIETRKHVENAEDIMDVLNQEAELIDEWREKLTKAVLLPLVDQEDSELTGEEYEKSTREEDTVHAYMEALRLIIADRAQVITSQRNLNVRREAAGLLRRANEGEGHVPELMKALLQAVNKLRPAESKDGDISISLRGTVSQLNQLRTGLEAKNRVGELAIVDRMVAELRRQSDDALKTVTGLEKELDIFSDAVNARVEYYRQLQIISDLVAPFEEDISEEAVHGRLAKLAYEESAAQTKASRFRGRSTFLQHLKTDPHAENEERRCPICTDHFDNGVLTKCGHAFCKDCIQLWWSSHRTCPNCKQTLAKSDLYPITYKPLELSAQEDITSKSPSQDSREIQPDSAAGLDNSIYTGIDTKSLDEIKSVDLPKSFGTKIDTLTRHLIWLREKEPGAKSVIFSQFREFFGVLEEAFDTFKIGWASMDKGSKGVEFFKKDRGVEVLLLHAKAQASGLNLVNATHVFLCEPLINTAIELQVIARVHRIGQNATTTVWQYLIENTVEKSIYEISVDRRLSHIHSSPASKKNKKLTKLSQLKKRAKDSADSDLEADIEAANSLEIEAPIGHLLAKGTTGGETVADKDLWPCLFTYRPMMTALVDDVDRDRVASGFLAANAAEDRQAEMALR